MNDKIKKVFPRSMKTLHNCREAYYNWLGRHWPEHLIKIWYKHLYHVPINLTTPQTIDEKVNWMKLHADMSLWTRCADKYEVRKYVEECGLGFTLNEIYGVYDDAEEINFDALPQNFVIKTTNGGGGKSVLIVKDKCRLNVDNTRKKLNEWLKEEVGYRYYEPHYFNIKPRLLIEKYLRPNEGEDSLIDIKLNCFDGMAYSVFLCSDRHFNKSVHYSVYDLDWKYYPDKIQPKYRTEKIYPRPRAFGKMIEYSRILSKGIPYVRVDWYEIDGEPVFSELTFTPGGGFQHFYSNEYLLELGQQMKSIDI